MAGHSGSVGSSACLLLLVLLPLTLAQGDCHCHTSNDHSPECPDCLDAPKWLNGTYYISPEGSENTSCPALPCLTLAQLRDEFFLYYSSGLLLDAWNETTYKCATAPVGNATLVFLSGTHTLLTCLSFCGDNSSLSLSGVSHHPLLDPVINGTVPSSHLQFTGIDVTVTHLQFSKCAVNAQDSDSFVMEHITFNNSILTLGRIQSASITNTIIATSTLYKAGYAMVIKTESSYVNLTNILLSSDLLPWGSAVPRLSVEGGSLDIVDSELLGNGNYLLAVSGATLTVSGTVHFESGSPALQAQGSTVILGGSITFENGTPAIRAKDSEIYLAGKVLFDNGKTAIQIIETFVSIEGNVSLINNTGYQGGAMYLSSSLVSIADNAHVVFQDNHADHVGGAIYSTGNHISNYISVGFRADFCPMSFGATSSVEFINNTAESGGSAMYGISVSKVVCNNNGVDNTYEYLLPIVSIEPNDFSAVSSDPLRVCICANQSTPECFAILPDQNVPLLQYTVYPGQHFTISAAVVGFNFALTSGSVYAQLLSSDASLGSESQYVQGVSHAGCSQLEYSVLSDRKQETLVLTANGRSVSGIPSGIGGDFEVDNGSIITILDAGHIYNYINSTWLFSNPDGLFQFVGNIAPRPLQDAPVFITITLLDCPPGFTLSDLHHHCECNERVLEHNLTCNIDDQTVRRKGTTWINASFSGNSSNGVIVHQHCPFGYCRQEPVDVDLTNPDTQCAFDHSGTLCGACKPNFTLALGGSQCLPNCSNSYLSLVIPFALAGFVLVFFIKMLNLTVSQGTLNGLTFYANIVAANRSIFFPAQHSKFVSFLSVFISWLNLDLGIETCFINSLDGYWKTWLQLLFAVYVWAIAGAIILTSHYSTLATKIFGKSSVSVLATLFLLSYIKLLPFIITIFSLTSLEYPDGSTALIWGFDGNIDYLSPQHIPLFLFALAIVLLLGLPYTAILLSAQWLRTQTHRKRLRWLKPFLDAYYGPFKDKHHYWVGVLLVVRGVLFIFFAVFFAIENNVNLLLTIISSFSLAAFPGSSVYKVVYLSALENSFFLNLGVLAAGTLYIRLVGGSQEALVTTSVGIAFLQFVGITAFHAYHFVIVPIGNKCKVFVKARADNHYRVELQPLLNFDSDSDSDDDIRLKPRPAVVTHSEVCLETLRKEAEMQLQPHEESEQGPEIGQLIHRTVEQHQLQATVTADQFLLDRNSAFICEPPPLNVHYLEMADASANESAGASRQSEAAAVSLYKPPPPPPPPQDSNERPTYSVHVTAAH